MPSTNVKENQYVKLKKRIIEEFGSYTAFGKKVGLVKGAVSMKLSGDREIKQSEMVGWAHVLKIKKSEYGDYFFS